MIIKGITLAAILPISGAVAGLIASYATLSERVETARADVRELRSALTEQASTLHSIDNKLAVIDGKLSEHMRSGR